MFATSSSDCPNGVEDWRYLGIEYEKPQKNSPFFSGQSTGKGLTTKGALKKYVCFWNQQILTASKKYKNVSWKNHVQRKLENCKSENEMYQNNTVQLKLYVFFLRAP